MTRRCRAAAAVLILAGGCLLLLSILRTWDVVGAVTALIAVVGLAMASVVARRAALWSKLARTDLPVAAGWRATIGPPTALSPSVAGAPIRRRLGATVIPIHSLDGPQPGGGALVVHARSDRLALGDADIVRYWQIDRGGIVLAVPPTDQQSIAASGRRSQQSIAGRFVLARLADGAVFLATTRLTDTW